MRERGGLISRLKLVLFLAMMVLSAMCLLPILTCTIPGAGEGQLLTPLDTAC